MENPDLKHCPICNSDLPMAEFGICRARKDGRNLYCMSCIRKKVRESRRSLKEYKESRKQIAAKRREMLDFELTGFVEERQALNFKLSPVERVREAIRRGCRTQSEIHQETKLGKDEIGDALANLLLWSKEIRTVVVDDTRMYFINEPVEIVSYPQKDSLVEIARKGLGPVMKGERRVRAVA